IQSYAQGRAFGRVDLRVNPRGVVTGAKIYPPQDLCPSGAAETAGPDGSVTRGGADGNPVAAADCAPGPYEGRPVTPSEAGPRPGAPAIEQARARREELVGATLATAIPKQYALESAEGNLFADLMLAARPDADVAVTNGGGLRADLPAGALTYGA